jgi:8-oxo-dGTP diphosphatase
MKKGQSIGVVVIIKNKNKILLGKRLTPNGFKEWGLVGGHLESNETPEQCAIREVKEETNIKISDPCFITTINVQFPNPPHYKAIIFLSETIEMPKNTEPEKLEQWQWFKWDSLPCPLFLPVKMMQDKGIFKQIFKKQSLY